MPIKGKPNKFGARRTAIGSEKFDSRKEARRFVALQLLERGGEIRNLRRQVAFVLIGQNGPLKTRTGRAMKITLDFTYQDKAQGWETVYEDCKGMPARDYEVRKAVFEAMGYVIRET